MSILFVLSIPFHVSPHLSRFHYLSLLLREPTIRFANRSNTNQAVQSQEMARGWKFRIKKRKVYVAKTKVLISFQVNAKLICTFGFAYADCWFSHEAAHL